MTLTKNSIYTDGEEQELLRAAEIIQNAFRKYKVSHIPPLYSLEYRVLS